MNVTKGIANEYKSQKKHWINSDLVTITYKLKRADIQFRKLQKIFEFAPSAIFYEVEHELHFLFNCNLYDSLRSNFYRTLVLDTPIDFDNNEKTLLIVNNVDHHI